ncbi:hypothetical protein ACLOJK_016798 [Asimina triloba]
MGNLKGAAGIYLLQMVMILKKLIGNGVGEYHLRWQCGSQGNEGNIIFDGSVGLRGMRVTSSSMAS